MEIALAVGGALLSPSFQLLLDKLTSVDLLNYAKEGQVLDEINKWNRMLKNISAVLEDAEGRQMSDRRVKRWVSDLRDLAYDIEDILDEFNTELLRRKVEGVKPAAAASTSKVRKLLPSCCGGMNPTELKFNAEIFSKMERVTYKLDDIVKDKDLLGLTTCEVRPTQVRARPPTSSLLPGEEEILGREKDKQDVLDLLKAQATNPNLSVIPIVGMGGVGKTTLAQLIYNHQSLYFDLKAWVCDGEDFDIYGITKKILKKLGGGDDDDLSSAQERLKDKLSGNKFFIVVDDIWKENYENWTRFRAPFLHGAPGSILMVTTRSREVSNMAETIPAYTVDKLSTDDCLSVFAQHALGERNFDQHLDLEEIGNGIVKKCQGLPLAAKALGGLLKRKQSANVWQQVLKSRIWDLPDEKCNVFQALRLSYFHLPSHLKVCFAYCAIFPKDYEFDSKELILLWMAEGFLNQAKQTVGMEELGDQYFCDLLSRSFFQLSSSNKSLYVMHDLINDLARSVSGEICFQLGDDMADAESYAKVRHSSFVRQICDVAQRFEVFYKLKSLRTFVALPISSGCHFLSRKVVHDLVPQLICLRTLSLSGIDLEELPASIGALKHLRYLNLTESAIYKLPESVCQLVNLQIMILCWCHNLVELPKGIHKLINLLCLDIRGTHSLKEMPPQISSLIGLLILSDFIVGKGDAGLGVNKLMDFPHLQGQLRILNLQNVVDFRDAEYANLKGKVGLRELDLEWSSEISSPRNTNAEFEVLNALQPHQNLSSLSIHSFGGTAFPSWMGDHRFTNMVKLEVYNCPNVTSLPSLGRLHSLKELSIGGMNGLKEIGVVFYEDSSCFACLETLNFKNMREWEQWSWSDGLNEADGKQFPNLLKLEIVYCPKLVDKLPRFLPSLNSLRLEGCLELVDSPKLLPSLTRCHLRSCTEIILKNMSNISCLTHLTISKISGLVSLHEALIQALAALKELSISYCEELVYLWHDGTNLDNLSCLKTLKIEGCGQLVSLVEGEVGLFPSNLEELNIWSCGNLKKLSNGLHYSTSLKVLMIQDCNELVALPEKGLPNSLKQINIIGCKELWPKGIIWDGNDNHQQMSQLEVLSINGSPSSPFGELPKSLKFVSLSSCTAQLLESLDYGPRHLIELKVNDLSDEFPEKGLSITTLQVLRIESCEKLRSFPTQMQNLRYLQTLVISSCPLLESFPVSGLPLPSLSCLEIRKCNKLRSLPNQIENLTSLQSLVMDGCGALCFPEGGFPRSLTELHMANCDNWGRPLSELGLHRLTSLKELRMAGSNPSTDMIVSFPGNDGLLLPNSLTIVHITKLKNLQSVSEGIQSLTSLQTLFFAECSELQYLPKEGLPATLGVLSFYRCPHMRRRCLKDKGELWPIIADIPRLVIDK